MNDVPPPDRRRQPPEYRRRRSGEFFSNPIVMAVVAGLIINAAWAVGVYAWQAGADATHEYYRHYGAGIVEKAMRTNDPEKLHELIAKVQNARSP